MQAPPAEPAQRRLNVRAAIILTAVVIAAVVIVAVDSRTASRLRPAALADARRLADEGRVNRAVANLEAFLWLYPLDAEAMEMEAKLLAGSAVSLEQLINAATFNDHFVRTYPEAAGAQDARRRTADLYLRFSDRYLMSSYYASMPETTAFNSRYRAAAAVAQSLIDRGARDAGAYQLLARAQEHLARGGDAGMVKEALRSYERAIELDPDDLLAAERLANLLVDLKRDKARAARLLDRLARQRPSSNQARLVRYRFHVKLGDDARASAEMEALLKLSHDDPSTCLEAAEMNLRRGRTAEARRFLVKVPEGWRDAPRVLLIRGLIELNEGRPEEAVRIWREVLIASRGSDAMLTWNLAYTLIQLGRLDEAGPLVAQFRRLVADDASPMLTLLVAAQEQKTGDSYRASLRLEGLRPRIDPKWRQILENTLGRCHAESGDLAKAIRAYRRVLQENPRSVVVRVELAEVLAETRPQEAAIVAEAGLQISPDEPSLWVALASALIRKQEQLSPSMRLWEPFDRAMARAVELAPGHPSLTTIRSRRQALEGKADDAVAILEQAVGREPRKAKLWEAYVETLLKAGRPAQALGVLDRAAGPEAVGNTVGIRLARSQVLASLGRAREGRDQLTAGLDRLPRDQRARIWDAMGRDLAARGDVAGAIGLYVEWAGQVPEDGRPRRALLDLAIYGEEADRPAASEALRGLGGADDVAAPLDRALELIRRPPGPAAGGADEARLREAERLLEAAQAADPQAEEVEALRGELAERRGLIGEAATAYRRAWDRGSQAILPRLVDLLARHSPGELERLGTLNGSPRAVRLAVQAFIGLGQPERAARVAAAEPDASEPPEARDWRVEQLDRLGRPELAEAVLRAESTRRPDSAAPWLALIRHQAGRGLLEAAAATLEGARNAIRDDRVDFVEARLRQAAGDPDAADEAFRLALRDRPDDVEVLLAAADFARERGRPAEAEAHLGRVLALDGGHRPAARKLALLLASGPPDAARWERARAALGPESAGAEAVEDRLARAMVLAGGPGPDHRRRAVGLLEALVVDLPGDSGASRAALGLLARLLLDDGQAERAAGLLGTRGGRGDGDPSVTALHAEALLRAGDLDGAGAQLDRLARFAPGDPAGARLRARLVAALAGPGEAPAELERGFLAAGDSPSSTAFGREAFALIATAQPPADDVAARLGLRLASKDPKASWMPAMIAGRRGRADEALRLCLVAAEAADPADAREAARVASGVALADPRGDHLARLDAVLEAAGRRDPGGTEVPLQVAQLRQRQGRSEEAVRIYREVVGRRPDLRASIQNNLAWILSEDLHRPEEAIAIADDLLLAGGRTAAALDTRGVILARLGRHREAIRDLEDASRIAPDPAHLFHLARAYRDAGKPAESARCRDLARRAGLTPAMVEPSERADLESLMGP